MAKQRTSLSVEDRDEFVQSVIDRYQDDLYDRSDWSEARLQRYAKLRGWMETKNYPWPDASNQHVPMLMTNSQRTQDTLHNAVMGTRPVMSAIAVNKVDAEKGTSIDELQDYQLFVEQNGEEKVGELITSFVDDGKAVAFIPWVKETREVRETKPIPHPAPGADPQGPLLQVLAETFPGSVAERHAPDRFTVRWTTETGQAQQAKVSVFEDEDGATFAQITKKATIFDGPCIIPVALEDLVVPSRAANLQPPGPSNPNGADHVVMVDYPSWDEIKRLQDRGYYDLLEDDELEVLEERVEGELGDTSSQTMTDPEQHKVQKDALAGLTFGNAKTSAKVFTRLTYFGRWDIDDDGFEEEIVARVLLESKQLCRLRHLQDEYPTPTPRRPFAEATFLPVPGQFYGISLIELLEHTHDLSKVILDQMIDKHSISNSPWGLYRSASGMRPEVVRMSPGELYPVSNPQTDVVFPQLPQGDQSVAMNILALLQQWAEKSSMQGALQFGAVPQGKSSALRTSSNMANVLQQGDARPERILRRFFLGLSEIYQQMHELNQAFLPPKKQYRVTGVVPEGADPYKTVEHVRDISGRFQFDFKANSLNTNKAAQAQILTQLSQLLVNGMTFQMGLMDKEKFYNLLSDITKANGQDPNRYIIQPPDANVPKITAADAMGQMAQGILPQGIPSEGPQQHLQTLQQFMRDPRYAALLHSEPAFQLIFQTYVQQVQGLVQKQQQEAMMAQQFAQMQGGGAGGQPGPPGAVDPQADQMNLGQGPGQVGDESLPGAKGMM